MRYITFLSAILALYPATSHAAGLTELITGFVGFLNNTVIPFLLALGFLFFAFNVIRYFVLGGASDDGREKAKSLAIYSVMAFVVLVVFWGIVNLTASLLGFAGTAQPTADYIDPDSVKNSGIKQTASSTNSGDTTNTPVNVLPPQFPENEAGGSSENANIACTTKTANGNDTTIITSRANCVAAGGKITE